MSRLGERKGKDPNRDSQHTTPVPRQIVTCSAHESPHTQTKRAARSGVQRNFAVSADVDPMFPRDTFGDRAPCSIRYDFILGQ